jgi:hypothetical protein
MEHIVENCRSIFDFRFQFEINLILQIIHVQFNKHGAAESQWTDGLNVLNLQTMGQIKNAGCMHHSGPVDISGSVIRIYSRLFVLKTV